MANILLVGARASGKSAVGRRAAHALGSEWTFVEMDEAVAARLGTSISDYFAAHGEAAFRQQEHALLEEIARERRRIVACGGGVAGTLESLGTARAAGALVWMDTPADELIARRLADPDEARRPALIPGLAELKAEDLEAYLHVEAPSILARRQPYYQQADFVIAAKGLSVDRLAVIVAALARGTPLE